MEFLLHHQWIAYVPGLALLAIGVLRLFSNSGSAEDERRDEDNEELPRVIVTQEVPSVFDHQNPPR